MEFDHLFKSFPIIKRAVVIDTCVYLTEDGIKKAKLEEPCLLIEINGLLFDIWYYRVTMSPSLKNKKFSKKELERIKQINPRFNPDTFPEKQSALVLNPRWTRIRQICAADLDAFIEREAINTLEEIPFDEDLVFQDVEKICMWFNSRYNSDFIKDISTCNVGLELKTFRGFAWGSSEELIKRTEKCDLFHEQFITSKNLLELTYRDKNTPLGDIFYYFDKNKLVMAAYREIRTTFSIDLYYSIQSTLLLNCGKPNREMVITDNPELRTVSTQQEVAVLKKELEFNSFWDFPSGIINLHLGSIYNRFDLGVWYHSRNS